MSEITVPPTAWGVSNAALTGAARVFGVGPARFQGTLTDNATPVHWHSHGEFVLTTPNGTVTLYVHGEATNLNPRPAARSHLVFEVAEATGQYAAEVGKTGTADLLLVAQHRSRKGEVRGPFFLRLRDDPSNAGEAQGWNENAIVAL
jgi:hypothetical protein